MLFLGAGGLYAYDQTRDDLIADGVTVGGIEVGGMHASDARDRLAAALSARYSQPIAVRAGERTFRLSAKRAHLTYDVRAMVDAAVQRSREGSIFSRTYRAVRGEAIHADLPAQVHYNHGAVTRFVTGIERHVNRRPQNASVNFSGDGIGRVPGHDGVVIDSRRLRRQLAGALNASLATKLISVRERRVEPKVKLRDLAHEYPYLITINRSAFRLNFFRDLKLVKTYKIAVGQVGLETPAGLYHIQNKEVNPAWHVPNSAWAGSLAGQVIPGGTPQNPLKARWMGIFDGAGIHGTDNIGSLGSAASHGCIRMAIPDVVELYDKVPVGAPVYIA